jgi:hypothetical protein
MRDLNMLGQAIEETFTLIMRKQILAAPTISRNAIDLRAIGARRRAGINTAEGGCDDQ